MCGHEQCLCRQDTRDIGGWLVHMNGRLVFLPDDEEGLE